MQRQRSATACESQTQIHGYDTGSGRDPPGPMGTVTIPAVETTEAGRARGPSVFNGVAEVIYVFGMLQRTG